MSGGGNLVRVNCPLLTSSSGLGQCLVGSCGLCLTLYYMSHVSSLSHSGRFAIDVYGVLVSLTKICVFSAINALTLLVWWQEAHPACKKQSGEVLVWLSVWSEVQTCTCPADATATHYLLLQ